MRGERFEHFADLGRHQFCSTNNLWFDLAAMKEVLIERDGVEAYSGSVEYLQRELKLGTTLPCLEN